MSTERLTKAFSDAIAIGPHSEWVQVRLDFVEEAIDHMEWLEKGNAEWRGLWQGAAKQNTAARATARVAIGHLQAVLNKARTHEEQQQADTAARDWLQSIGNDSE